MDGIGTDDVDVLEEERDLDEGDDTGEEYGDETKRCLRFFTEFISQYNTFDYNVYYSLKVCTVKRNF